MAVLSAALTPTCSSTSLCGHSGHSCDPPQWYSSGSEPGLLHKPGTRVRQDVVKLQLMGCGGQTLGLVDPQLMTLWWTHSPWSWWIDLDVTLQGEGWQGRPVYLYEDTVGSREGVLSTPCMVCILRMLCGRGAKWCPVASCLYWCTAMGHWPSGGMWWIR